MFLRETISENIKILFEIVDKIRNMEIQIADDIISILPLCSFLENFENFRCSIESRDKLTKPNFFFN